MNTVRKAPVTKSGNPLCDKSHAELTLRVMRPFVGAGHARDQVVRGQGPLLHSKFNEVAA